MVFILVACHCEFVSIQGTAPLLSRLRRESEGENVGAGGSRHVLPSIHHVCHRRRFPGLVSIEMPKSAAGLGVGRRERSARLTIEDYAARSGKDSGIVRFCRTYLRNFPDYL